MNLFRCFPWDREVAAGARGGAIWFARMLQGEGRHDNPLLFGCLYCSADPVAAVVEQLARFAGRPLRPQALTRFGLPLALARLELDAESPLVDLDDPAVLAAEELRPSVVATNERERTQADAAELFRRHPDAAGLRWWSTFESQWANVTLFDRRGLGPAVAEVREIDLADETVGEAVRFLGLRVLA